MHSAYRELNTKYMRAVKDLEITIEQKDKAEKEMTQKQAENIEIQKEMVTKNTQIGTNIEKISTLSRELDIKIQQVLDFEKRNAKSQDEIDLLSYKLQEQQKDITEMRLKTDVLSSTNDGLMSEKKHLTTELNETRSLYKTYEEKCSELMNSLHEQTTVY